MDDVVVVGTEHAPNLEVIAALRPDLIIGNKSRQEEVYQQLSAIAPTVFSTALRCRWQENLMVYARALGREDEGQAPLGSFAARPGACATGLGCRLQGAVHLVRILPGR